MCLKSAFTQKSGWEIDNLGNHWASAAIMDYEIAYLKSWAATIVGPAIVFAIVFDRDLGNRRAHEIASFEIVDPVKHLRSWADLRGLHRKIVFRKSFANRNLQSWPGNIVFDRGPEIT